MGEDMKRVRLTAEDIDSNVEIERIGESVRVTFAFGEIKVTAQLSIDDADRLATQLATAAKAVISRN